MSSEPEPKAATDKANLATIVAGVGALLTALGTLSLTGVLGRVQRNEGTFFAIGLCAVAAGAALWLVASLITIDESGRKRRSQWVTQILAVVLTLMGLLGAVIATVRTANDTEQAAVSIKVADDGQVTGKSSVANLASSERLTMRMNGLVLKNGEYMETALYDAYVGPDGDGKAAHEATVRLPPRRFDAVGIQAWTAKKPKNCGEDAKDRREQERAQGTEEDDSATGCAIVQLPYTASFPQVSASWEGAKRDASSLKVTLEVPAMTAVPRGSHLVLRVAGRRGKDVVPVYRASFVSPSSGGLKREVRIPVEGKVSTVCVQGRFGTPNKSLRPQTCPSGEKSRGADVVLRVPRP